MVIDEELAAIKVWASGRTSVKDEDRLRGLRKDIFDIVAEVDRLRDYLITIRKAAEELANVVNADTSCSEENKNTYYEKLCSAGNVDTPCDKKSKDIHEWIYGPKYGPKGEDE